MLHDGLMRARNQKLSPISLDRQACMNNHSMPKHHQPPEKAMTAKTATQTLQAAPATALPGTWKLVRGRAVTLRPATDGILRVAHGRVWATIDGPHGRTPDDSGDHMLEVGRSMFVRAGQRVVIEAWNGRGASYFGWDPVTDTVRTARRRLQFAGVLQPLAELRVALVVAGGAFVRLLVGIARLALPAAHNGRHGNALPVR
jgi:hypothetical protein